MEDLQLGETGLWHSRGQRVPDLRLQNRSRSIVAARHDNHAMDC